MSVDILEKFGLTKQDGEQQDIVNIPLSSEDMAELLELLSFTASTAAFVAQQEMIKGGPDGVKTAAKMNRYSNNAQVLMEYVMKHAKIGEPVGGVN